MTVRFARPLIAGIAATLLMTMSSCTDDKPKPIPEPTGSTAPKPSTAPDAPKLNAAQKAAFKDAVGDYADARKVIDRLSGDPKNGLKDIEDLRDVTYSPALNSMAKDIKRRADSGVSTEGSRKAAWQVPLTVELDAKPPTITWQQCSTPGDLKVIQKGSEVEQEQTNRLLRITSNPDAKSANPTEWFWRIADVEETGTC